MVDEKTDFFENTDNFAKTANIPSIQIITCDFDFKPKISIVIPTYKRVDLLKEAIDSAIHQIGYENYDILVVDNDPERYCDTEALLMSYNCSRLIYYKNTENIGMFGNWNRCIELARGEWTCMLHDDDKLESNYLRDLSEIIDSKSDAGFISCRLKLLNQNKDENKNFKNNILRSLRVFSDSFLKVSKVNNNDFLFGFNAYLVGSCFKKELAIQIGGFNADYFPSADYYFVVKFQYNFNNVYHLRKKNYIYRILNNESLNLTTSRFFLINDFHFQNFLIKYNRFKISFLLYFLNKEYVINRLQTQRDTYNVQVELDSVLKELKIPLHYKSFLYQYLGKLMLKILTVYRLLVKF
ncbi:MAG TPA: hypothetical protein DER05_08355 [Lutibacter sp.]|nr:hypothetical protein [Lutibacter sp.]